MDENNKKIENEEPKITIDKYALRKSKRRFNKNTFLVGGGVLLVGGLITAAILVPTLMRGETDPIGDFKPKGTKLDLSNPTISSLASQLEGEAAKGTKLNETFDSIYLDKEIISFQYKNDDALKPFIDILKVINKEKASKMKNLSEKITTTIEFKKSTGTQTGITCEFRGTKNMSIVVNTENKAVQVFMNNDLLEKGFAKPIIGIIFSQTPAQLNQFSIEKLEMIIKDTNIENNIKESRSLYFNK